MGPTCDEHLLAATPESSYAPESVQPSVCTRAWFVKRYAPSGNPINTEALSCGKRFCWLGPSVLRWPGQHWQGPQSGMHRLQVSIWRSREALWAGVKSAATGTELAFTFTMKNKSSSTSADVDFWITFTGSEGGPAEDYICPLISTHANISPDASFCFPGVLGPGKTTQAAVLTPKSGSPMSVQACAEDVSNYADPVSSNNCKTLTVK